MHKRKLFMAILLGLCLCLFAAFGIAYCKSAVKDPDESSSENGLSEVEYSSSSIPEGSSPVEEQTETAGLLYSFENNQYCVTGYTGTDTDVVIPSTYNGYPVTSIGMGAFYGCSSLTSVVIPDSITSIGMQAFDNCSSLQYNVKDNIKYLGNTSNPYVVVKGVTDTTLTSYTIENSAKIIYDSAFWGCSLTSITIPDGVTSIGDCGFAGCDSLASVTIGNSVTSIGKQAFSGKSLTSILVRENNTAYTSIDGNLYSKDGKMLVQYATGKSAQSFTIPDGVTSIGSYAFVYCSSLTSIKIPDDVTSIGAQAFSGCSSLMSITIPDSITSIGTNAFYDCSSLQYNVKNNILYLGNANHPYVVVMRVTDTNLTSYTIENRAKVIYSSAFRDCSRLTSIKIPDSITNIGYRAFYSCSSLTSIKIPDSVTSIGNGAFCGCESLTSIFITEENTAYQSIDGNLYSKDGKTLVRYAAGKSAQSFTIPDSVTSIGEYAFYNCEGLTSIEIPSSVTSIGYEAFYGCSSLTSIEIPDSVTSIGVGAFKNCNSLTSVTFKNTSGWTAGIKSISSADLENPSTAAKYLTSTYRSYSWQHR